MTWATETAALDPKRRNDEPSYDPVRYRGDFPIFAQKINGKRLVYLDNAATAQKPDAVIDTISRFYSVDYANIHRGVHTLSQRATERYEAARTTVQRLLGAKDPREIIFVRGTTEGINLIANTFGRSRVKEGDEILLTGMEHHSNIVPWQILCQQTGARLRIVGVTDRGELQMDEFRKLLSPRTKIVSLCHVSNSLGTINPVAEIIVEAHRHGVPVILDGAQAVPHLTFDVAELDCDFYAFSGHKVYGPTGIGAVYGKLEHLQKMPPYQGGGDMIRSVTFEKTEYNDVPQKFEAGTTNIAGAIGLAAAIDYVNSIGRERIAGHETELLAHATENLSRFPQVRIIGQAEKKASVLSFVLKGIHAHDIGTVLDQEGIAIRAGHHCTQPLMERFGVPATARASFALYNTKEDADILADGVGKTIKLFG
ncbi:MAG: cysteine desulfurase [Pseudomonadota bacterium]